MPDLQKSPTEIIRIEKREFKKREFIDIRTYYEDESGEYKPTKKGVTINPSLIDELVEALNSLK